MQNALQLKPVADGCLYRRPETNPFYQRWMHGITPCEARTTVKSMSEVQLQVSGMTCGHCEKAVVKAVLQVQGVAAARADRTTGQVVVSIGGADPDVAAIVASIVDEGYAVHGQPVVTA